MLNGRLSTHLDSIFTKKTVYTLLNIHAARIFMKVQISNWYLEMQLGFILTGSKNVQDWIHFLINIPVIIIGATLNWVETSLSHYFFNQCWYSAVSLCWYAKVYKYADAEVSTSVLMILKGFLKMVNRFPSSDDFCSSCSC